MQQAKIHESRNSTATDELVGDVTFRADAEGYFTYVNKDATTLTGFSTEDLLGMHFTALVDERDRKDVVRHYVGQLKSRRQVTHKDFAIRCKDGTRKYVEQSVELDTVDGQVVGVHAHVRDITERTLVEAELRRSERRFRTIFESSPDAIFIEDLSGIVLDVNPAACELHGLSRSDLIGKHVSELVPPEHREETEIRFPDLAHGATHSFTGYSLRKNGRVVPVEIRSSRFSYGNQQALLLHVRDISERVEAEKALLRSERTNSAILAALPDLIFWISKDGEYLHFVARDDARLAVPREKVLGNNIRHTLPPRLYKRMIRAVELALETGELQMIQYALEVGSASDFEKVHGFFEARIVPAEQETVLMIVRDISRRRLLEQQVVYVKEEERRRIGRDLHDGMGSLLTGIAMLSRGLEQDAARGKPINSKQLGEIARLATAGVDQARALARGLNPVKLEDEGLIPALEKLTQDTETYSKIAIRFISSDNLPAVDEKMAAQVYWIAQEAINNAVRHAGASQIAVSLSHKGETCELVVADDGVGIQDISRSEGLGVPIMNYRAQLIGARLVVAPGESGGTEVRCVIPSC